LQLLIDNSHYGQRLADNEAAKSLRANKAISQKISLARGDIKTVLGALK